MNTPEETLRALGIAEARTGLVVGGEEREVSGDILEVSSPVDGRLLAQLELAATAEVEPAVQAAREAFLAWRTVPAPVRGELVRRYAEMIREHKQELGRLITWEVGKIPQEAEGEVQEMIDVCDFAVGLSRQLYGLVMASERPRHRLAEQWHPLGPVGILSAFNFPVAVWSWNAALALVCGDPVVWKPSEKTPLGALACQRLLQEVIRDFPDAPAALSSVVVGGRDVGEALTASSGLPLISATGSVPMGRAVAETVGKRLGKALLELGGNNAMIVTPSADLELALRAIVFSAVGTTGQRCTTLRRLIVHESIRDRLVERLRKAYATLPIGNPFAEGTLVGPLIDEAAGRSYEEALQEARSLGGTVSNAGPAEGCPEGGTYVKPAIVEFPEMNDLVRRETFAPILYVLPYENFPDAIAMHNDVPQGLSSAIFTEDVREAEWFCGPEGSDCGIANVNIGTSGAEIGGAFGGEKETGGGRESGSDAWKNYMRRATNTINYSDEMPLAQGIRFGV